MHCSSSIAVNFLTSSTTGLSLRLDNNGARFLTQKTGSGKIKHMAGKYLWMQQVVDAQTLDVKQKSQNTSDLGTKGLQRNRMYALMP